MSTPDERSPQEFQWIGRQLWGELDRDDLEAAAELTPETSEQLTQRALDRLLSDSPLLTPPEEIWERPNKEELAARFVLAGQEAILQEVRPESRSADSVLNPYAQREMLRMLGVIGNEMELSTSHEDAVRALDMLEAYLEAQIASTKKHLKAFESGRKTP